VRPTNITFHTISLEVAIPRYLIAEELASYLKLSLKSINEHKFLLYPINGKEVSVVVLNKLKHATRYEIQAATGNGSTFGMMSKPIVVSTKGMLLSKLFTSISTRKRPQC